MHGSSNRGSAAHRRVGPRLDVAGSAPTGRRSAGWIQIPARAGANVVVEILFLQPLANDPAGRREKTSEHEQVRIVDRAEECTSCRIGDHCRAQACEQSQLRRKTVGGVQIADLDQEPAIGERFETMNR